MKRSFLLLCLSFMMLGSIGAQNIMDTVMNIGAQTVPAFMTSLTQDEKTVQNAMKDRLKEAKLKTTNAEGCLAVLGQVVPDIATVPINMYVKIDESGRRSDKVTVVTICAMPMNIADRVPEMNIYVRRFLENFIQRVNKAANLEMLEKEEKALKKATKEYNSSASDLAKIEKNIKSDEDKIASNDKDIEKLQGKIKSLEDKIKSLEESNQKLQASVSKNSEKKSDAEKKMKTAEEEMQSSQAKVDELRSKVQ